jgi:hypothetical protein
MALVSADASVVCLADSMIHEAQCVIAGAVTSFPRFDASASSTAGLPSLPDAFKTAMHALSPLSAPGMSVFLNAGLA